jgi:cytochrome c biogenesis factor
MNLKGVKILTLFSLSGIIFLSIVFYQIKSDYQYLKIKVVSEENLITIGSGVLGAIFLYILCFLVSGFYWYKYSRITSNNVDD